MAVSETLVRECLEQRGLLVRQCRKYVTPHAGAEADIDFLVVNPRPLAEPVTLPAVLEAADLAHLVRAVVAVRAWHTETFTPARISHAPEVLRFVEPARLQRAVRALGPGPAPARILVLPALPHTDALRRESLELLRARGVDAVLPFRTVLADLIEQVETNRNYQKSDLLQTLRLLKRYGFFRDPHLDLFQVTARRTPRRSRTP